MNQKAVGQHKDKYKQNCEMEVVMIFELLDLASLKIILKIYGK